MYESRGYIERHAKPSAPKEIVRHAVVAPGGAYSQGRAARWLQTMAPGAVVAARSGSLLGLFAAAKAGTGLTLLPRGMGEREPELVRVLEPHPPVAGSLYLLMHPDLRSIPRFRAFFDFFVSECKQYRSSISGASVAGRSEA